MSSTAATRLPVFVNRRPRRWLIPALVACASLWASGASAQSQVVIDSATAVTGPDVPRADIPAPNGTARPFDTRADLASPANGFAKPAVAKDVIGGHAAIHAPAYTNDGLYGNGASWISASPDSWVKIDLGRVVLVDGVRFGRDRTGGFDDRDPGQFVVALAVSDDVYADGNDQNDAAEYSVVFDSAAAGFSGQIDAAQTLRASFAPRAARYVRVLFNSEGAAIDEVEVSGLTEVDACVSSPCDGYTLCNDLAGVDGTAAGRTCVAAGLVTINLGTTAPTGSLTHNALKSLALIFAKVSEGRVQLKLFVGGTMGDEAAIVKKMRLGTVQGAMLSTFGLQLITPGSLALNVPGLVRTAAERDHVLPRIAPTLEAALEAQNRIVLTWSELGTQHLFSKAALPTLAAMRQAKLFAPEGHLAWRAALQELGLKPVVLSTVDIMPSLQTGVIDAVPVTPADALAKGLHLKAKFMSDLPWSRLEQALVIDKTTWNKIPVGVRQKLVTASKEIGARLVRDSRADETRALAAMTAQGLTITPFAEVDTWYAALTAIYPTRVRGPLVPAETYDALLQLLSDFRQAR